MINISFVASPTEDIDKFMAPKKKLSIDDVKAKLPPEYHDLIGFLAFRRKDRTRPPLPPFRDDFTTNMYKS